MSEGAMTVADQEAPIMQQGQKIAQSSREQPEFGNNADERENGLTGCCVAEKPMENHAVSRVTTIDVAHSDVDTAIEGQNCQSRTSADGEARLNIDVHFENVLLISATDDAKRESRDRNTANQCNLRAGDSDPLHNGQNNRMNDGPLRSDNQSSGLSLEGQTQNAANAENAETAKHSIPLQNADKMNCAFDENESLMEQLNGVELKRQARRSVGQKLIVTCEPYVPEAFQSCSNVQTSVELYDPDEELNFHEAVRAGDAKSVEKIIVARRSLNLDEPDWNVSGDPPLLVAATNHCLPVLRVLLENGCDPAVRSPRGETALHRAIVNGGPGTVLKLVGELLESGCPPGVKEAGGGLTALHVLTRQLANAQGSKSLHHDFQAALETLEILAKAGPVNAKDHQGRSALHILASSTIFDNNHRTEIGSLIKILLDAGADPSLKNDRGETPLHESLECGALNTAFLLTPHTPVGITSRYGETPLHIASRKNYIEMVTRLLEHGEDPSLQDAGGNTPLHLASGRGFHQTVSMLVTSPLAQLERTNAEGLTALQVAAESGFVNAVRLLLKAGADPSQTVAYCTTTLHRHPDISVLIDHELTRRRQLAA